MALNLAKVVIGYLKDRPEEKFSARQIADWVFATYPDECQEKRANSCGDYIKSDADLVQQLVAEISSQCPRMQTKHPELKTTGGIRVLRRVIRLSHPAVQHNDLDGPVDAEHPAVLRAV